MLLFGDCVKELWKHQIGMVFYVTNAQLGDSNDANKNGTYEEYE